MKLEKDRLLSLYSLMVRMREFENEAIELAKLNLTRAAVHTCNGEEAIGAAVCSQLRNTDYITSTHRGHGHCVAKGADMRRMFAELMARETGYCKGKGGSMHIADLGIGMLGANGIVGGGIPLSIGAAFAQKYNGTDNVVVCFFGDGASNEGTFHESINMASVLHLPVIFLCENNQYAISTSTAQSLNIENIADRAVGYGIPGYILDGNDVVEMYSKMEEIIADVRAGKGPVLVEAKTYRMAGHYYGDNENYRTKDEVASWKEKCPIKRCRELLISEYGFAAEDLLAIDKQQKTAVLEACEVAKGDPFPDPADLADDLYDPTYAEIEWKHYTKPQVKGPRKAIPMREAINEALHTAFNSDPTIYSMGEDIAVYGGQLRCSYDLFTNFGEKRIFDTPISENAIMGLAIGSSMVGLRPVAEISYIDFIGCCFDQILNQAAKLRYMYGGRVSLPLVIRTQCGAGLGNGAQHSQSLEAILGHIPGIRVLVPCDAYEAKGLLLRAIRDNNPVVFVEHKALYKIRCDVPEEEYELDYNSFVKREGSDVTIVAYSAMVAQAMKAAEALEKEGVQAEVVVLRSVAPFDAEPIIASVKKTGKLVIVHEACRTGGFGAEIAATVQEKAFDYLKKPICRVAAPDVPVPFAPVLEKAYVPDYTQVLDAVHSVL